ncbi:MAG TPA: class I SAM-dependent methyltransferase [Acidimicrobiales bacterium]|nr:class I SAM-dependent methyltransferase [Acidimicrobiales bacterium]
MALRGEAYDARFEQLEREGRYLHGEADLVCALLDDPLGAPAGPVLDAGCGTGRVGIELARRGVSVTGVDLDRQMLEAARAKAPALPWIEADLARKHFDPSYALVVAAGNVMIFLAPGTAGAVVANLSGALVEGGLLVAGFQLDGRLDLAAYDANCAAAGLELSARYGTWEQGRFDGGDYAVSVHRRTAPGAR